MIAETSMLGFDAVAEKIPARERRILDTLSRVGPMTSGELMQALDARDPNSVRPRLTAMKEAGLVRVVGQRPCRAHGTVMKTWVVVGRDARSSGPTALADPADRPPGVATALTDAAGNGLLFPLDPPAPPPAWLR